MFVCRHLNKKPHQWSGRIPTQTAAQPLEVPGFQPHRGTCIYDWKILYNLWFNFHPLGLTCLSELRLDVRHHFTQKTQWCEKNQLLDFSVISRKEKTLKQKWFFPFRVMLCVGVNRPEPTVCFTLLTRTLRQLRSSLWTFMTLMWRLHKHTQLDWQLLHVSLRLLGLNAAAAASLLWSTSLTSHSLLSAVRI